MKKKHACPLCKSRFGTEEEKLDHFVRRHMIGGKLGFARCVCGGFLSNSVSRGIMENCRSHIIRHGGVDAHVLAVRLGVADA